MNTISVKELRDNLESIMARVNAGEEIVVRYRNKYIALLRTTPRDKSKKDTIAALEALEKAPRKKVQLDPTKSFK